MPPTVRISSTQSALRVPRKRIAALVAYVAHQEGVRLREVDLAVVSREEIVAVNRQWLHRSDPTDVISWDLSDSGEQGVTAQLVVCGDVAVEQAKLRSVRPSRELMLYVVHGLLHLMGYEDHSVRGAVRMHAREEELLEAFLKGC